MNMVRAEFFKLIKQKGVYFLFLFIVLLCLLKGTSYENFFSIERVQQTFFGKMPNSISTMPFLALRELYYFIAMGIACTVPNSVGIDFERRVIGNAIAVGNSCLSYLFARLLTFIALSICLTVLSTFSFFLFSNLGMPWNPYPINVIMLIKNQLVSILLYTEFCLAFLLVGISTRKSVPAIVISLAIALLDSFLPTLIRMIPIKTFHVIAYVFPTTHMERMMMIQDTNINDLSYFVLICLQVGVSFVLFVSSYFIMTKRDLLKS